MELSPLSEPHFTGIARRDVFKNGTAGEPGGKLKVLSFEDLLKVKNDCSRPTGTSSGIRESARQARFRKSWSWLRGEPCELPLSCLYLTVIRGCGCYILGVWVLPQNVEALSIGVGISKWVFVWEYGTGLLIHSV